MRRLPRGWSAALVLLMAGCGSGHTPQDAAPPAAAVAVPTLPVSMRAPAPSPAVDTVRILVTSAGGVDAPGLDALVSVLTTRPATEVTVVATAVPTSGTEESGAATAVLDATTASGFPARVVNASAADAVAVALDDLAVDADLVVVGIDDGPALGAGIDTSASVGAARAASRRGIPAIAVTAADEHGVDLAAATLLLGSLLDLELEAVLAEPVTILTIPSCGSGTVRGPLRVVAAGERSDGSADCTATDGEHTADVAAHDHGYATLVTLRG